ncbi:MAG: NAD(P)-dependent oxidoreductase, partial [Acidimicrobiales bacterium]
MRILLADSLPDLAVDRLRSAGDEVVVDGSLTADDLPGAIAGHEVLVVRSTRVTAETLAAADRLGLIVRAGAGTNTIDCEAAAARGVFVCNVPGMNSLAVAELTLGLLLAVDRRIPDATADLREGRWEKGRYARADGLFGKTFGIIGLGDIGLATAARAAAFGMEVIAQDKPDRPSAKRAEAIRAGVTFVPTREALLARSDVVSLHVPGGPATERLVDAAFLAMMKDRAILLNTSRGEVIDEDALLAAMDARGIRAGLDVFADEPGGSSAPFESRLARHPSVVATHHIGASTEQAQLATADGAVD